MLNVMELSFTQKQVVKIVEISSNTLQGWARDGLIIPSIANPKGRGRSRLYSPSDLTLIKIVSILSGFSYNRDVIKNFCDAVHGFLPFGRSASELAKKNPHIPALKALAEMQSRFLDPYVQHSSPVYLKLSDNKWEEIGSGEFATSLLGKSTVALIINVSKIMEEIKGKIEKTL